MPGDGVYLYRVDGKATMSQAVPPVGTEFTLTSEGGTVFDNGVVGRLSTRQQEALARKQQDAVQQAKNDALVKAQKAQAQKLAGAKGAVAGATRKLEMAGDVLTKYQSQLRQVLSELNSSLATRDAFQDATGVGLSILGVAVTVVVVVGSGGTALVVGGAVVSAGLAVAGAANEYSRVGKSYELSDVPGDANDLHGIIYDVAGRAVPAPVQLAMGGAGVLDSIDDAVGSTATSFSYEIYDPKQLDQLSAQVGKLGQEKFLGISKVDSDEVGKTQELIAQTKRQQEVFDDAMKDFLAKNKIYCDLLTTYSEPR